MRAIWAVFKRELALYFRSPIAYAIAFAVLGLTGVLFSANLISVVQQNTAAASPFGGQPAQIPASAVFEAPFLIVFLMFLIGPLLTMRLIAEENREGTLEVLMTLPMSESAFILGKFLAVWAYYTLLLLVAGGAQAGLLEWVGTLDWGVVGASMLGAWLYGGAALAIAMIWSAVTEDQIVAAFLGATSILILYLSDAVAIYVNSLGNAAQGNNPLVGNIATFFREIGLRVHYQATMVAGLIRVQDVLYYILVIVGALFITTRLVETRRWKG